MLYGWKVITGLVKSNSHLPLDSYSLETGLFSGPCAYSKYWTEFNLAFKFGISKSSSSPIDNI